MNPDDLGLGADIDLDHDPLGDGIDQMVQVQQQQAQQLAQAMQHLMQMQQQTGQAITQALSAIVQSNQKIAQALAVMSGPRRRIPIRDKNDRITEAHDLPMNQG